jgi:DNA-binding response OmpR family regulator
MMSVEGGRSLTPMNILIIDPTGSIASRAEPLFRARNWTCVTTADRASVLSVVVREVPDVILVHGDGPRGEAAHLCQRFKANALTSGIPLIVIEEAPPPAWLLMGMPAEAILQAPWEPAELLHHIESLLPAQIGSGSLDDLTNFPRRRSILDDLARRLLAREIFGVGLLSLRETEAYRQDYGRTGLDQFVVLVSVLLRRHTAGSTPVSIGYLEEGAFLITGSASTVHEIISQTIRDFDALVPAYYEMDTLFGQTDDHEVGPATWITLNGFAMLVEPDRFDHAVQIGAILSDGLLAGQDALQISCAKVPPVETASIAAD